MKLTIIGNNGVFPQGGGACSCYLVETGAQKILCDLGPGSLARLQTICAIDAIDVFVFSHLHYDHISDFFSLQYALQLKKARGQYHKKPLLILPKTPHALSETLADASLFEVCHSADGLMRRVGEAQIELAAMTHPVESYAVKICADGKTLVYSGDTDRPDVVRRFAAGADLFLSDAGLTEEHKTAGAPHMSVAEACAAGAEAKQTLLVHLSPLYQKDDLEREINGNAELSTLGASYTL